MSKLPAAPGRCQVKGKRHQGQGKTKRTRKALVQSHSHSTGYETGGPDRGRKRSHEVFFVEQILDAGKHFEAAAKFAGHGGVDNGEPRQAARLRVQIIVELRTDELRAGRDRHPLRVRVRQAQ